MKPSTITTAAFCNTSCGNSRRSRLDNAPADDRDERLLHRLEAFSDIVIGFSLAQSALSLTYDELGFEHMLRHPWGFLGFAMTFAAIASIWWSHNRLFARYFVPKMFNIVLNFVTLGVLVVFVFSVQILIKSKFQMAPMEFYVLMFAVTYLLLGTMYLIGAYERRAFLTHREFRDGLRTAVLRAAVGLSIMLLLLIQWRTGRNTLDLLIIPVVVFFGARIALRTVPGLR